MMPKKDKDLYRKTEKCLLLPPFLNSKTMNKCLFLNEIDLLLVCCIDYEMQTGDLMSM